METYAIRDSMRFAKETNRIAYRLETEKGYNILRCTYVDDATRLTQENLLKLELAHYKKSVMVSTL